MAQNQNQFLDDQNDDLRNKGTSHDVRVDNDDIGENTEQTPLAKSYTEEAQRNSEAEGKGWENNKPGITTANEGDERIPTVTPYNDNGLPGPDDDDDMDDDDDYDELIPTEGDEDVDEDEDDLVDKNADQHIDVSKVGGESASRPFGRTSGRMVDHEPGITGRGDKDRYDTTR
ncbi:MAG TPA: hypothetical protein VGE26_04890 [Sphingobacteriaceae bacterium]